MADGSKNLVPASSTDEARKRGKKGGIASGEARRRKKAMREMAERVLAAPIPVSKKAEDQLIQFGFEVNDANVQLMSLLAVARNAAKGDLAALAFLRDTAGERPTDKVDMTSRTEGDFIIKIGKGDEADNMD